MNKVKPELLLLDLGGVLIELTGVATMRDWLTESGNHITVEELWELWILSPTVRAFEKGASSPEEFGDDMVREFRLPVSPGEFLERYIEWPKGPYPGTMELLTKLRQYILLGCMTNTNELHWPIVQDQMGFRDKFDYSFPSHITGFLKPDREAYENVIKTTGLKPSTIFFFDDNSINVEGARESGITAFVTSGPVELVEELERLGLG